MRSIYVYGANGHGLVVADMAKSNGFDDVIFIDDGDNSYPSFEDVKSNVKIPIALGIGNNYIRQKLYKKIKEHGFKVETLVHPSAVISPSCEIGEGTLVMPNVVVNAKSNIGLGVILNTSCIVEHECQINDFVHISPNAALAGNVDIGEYAHIGIGTNIIQGIEIGKNSIIGASSNVIRNIDENKKAYGNPCKEIEDIKLP
jgi:UDP-N-acetylbacillosamine N-acetyltransferase